MLYMVLRGSKRKQATVALHQEQGSCRWSRAVSKARATHNAGERSNAPSPSPLSTTIYLGSIGNFTNYYKYQKAVLTHTKWASYTRDGGGVWSCVLA